MSFERLDTSSVDRPERPNPHYRFWRLLASAKNLVDTGTLANEGWRELPKRRVTIQRGEKTKSHNVQVFIHLPASLRGYESGSYSPSILMELDARKPQKDTGKISKPSRKLFVRENYLLEGSPYFAGMHKQAKHELAEMELIFDAYKQVIDVSKP